MTSYTVSTSVCVQ